MQNLCMSICQASLTCSLTVGICITIMLSQHMYNMAADLLATPPCLLHVTCACYRHMHGRNALAIQAKPIMLTHARCVLEHT